MSDAPPYAFVTLVTSDHYLPGALVVAAALRDIHGSSSIYPNEFKPSEFHIVCLVTPETVDISTIRQLRQVFDVVIGVEALEQDNEEGLRLLGRPDLRLVLTKLHIFRLTSYRKIIFLDADMLPVKPISHLFRLTSAFAAVPDVGWPDIFNSGFLVLEPGEQKFNDIMDVVKTKGSWDGGDQGVLNEWIGPNWDRLSFVYNTTPTAIYTYAPAYKRFGSQIHNVHFIGPDKPWKHMLSHIPTTGEASQSTGLDRPERPLPSYDYPTLLNKWFAVYDSHYTEPGFTPEYSAPSNITNPSISEDPISRRYDNIWDPKGELEHPDSNDSSKRAAFDLDELKKLAIEGSSKLTASGEQGNYMSLPLEGRVDLIRPRKPPALKETPQISRVLSSEGPRTPVRSNTPMQPLPTPGPNELPPAPSFRGGSLPPETPTYAGLKSTFFFNDNTQSPRPTTPIRRSSGRASPPLLLWNPAVEGPPSTVPPGAHLPPDAYYRNVWDKPVELETPTRSPHSFFHIPEQPPIPEMLIQQGHYKDIIGDSPLRNKSQSTSTLMHTPSPIQHRTQRSGLHGRGPSIIVTPVFTESSPLQLPNHYITEHRDMEGKEYVEEPLNMHSEESGKMRDSSHVSFDSTEHDQSPSYARPDRSKVTPVFPWEQKPRIPPKRLFPQTDSPPPDYTIMKSPSPPPTAGVHPPSKEGKRGLATRVFPPDSHSVTSRAFPQTTTYENAWDAIPSIQKYASRLVKPVPQRSSVPPITGHSKKGSAGRWDELTEESSRDADADDEDEGDDETPPHVTASQNPSARTTKKVIHSKTYKTIGVQTMPKLTKNQFVQVQIEDFTRPRSSSRASRKESRSRSTSVRTGKPETGSPLEAPQITTTITVETSPSAETRSILSKSNETESPITASPLSTTSALPSQKKQRAPPKRRFDPARDVELFKRGSEEVLARFLKLDSWDNTTE